jgi:hypothetical protein
MCFLPASTVGFTIQGLQDTTSIMYQAMLIALPVLVCCHLQQVTLGTI